MSYDELKDWLYRIRSEIITFMPKIWQKKMIETIDEAIAAINRQQKLDDIMQPLEELEQEPTTKNNLGVDLILRQEAIDTIRQLYLDLASQKAVIDILKVLPSVTPQEPKTGHWIKIGDRGFGYSDIVICKCSECEYQQEFVGKFDGHNLIVDTKRADNYCSNCGADMREVKE